MPRLIRYLTSLAVIVLGLTALGWFDSVHLITAAMSALILDFVATRLVARARPARRRRSTRLGVPRSGVLPHAVRGVLLATGTLFVVALTHLAAMYFPSLKAAYLDRGRSRLERAADQLESEGNWLAAAELLASRCEQPASSAWSSALRLRASLNLAQAAAVAPDEPTGLAYLERAAKLSGSSRHHPPVLDALKRISELRSDLDRAQVQMSDRMRQVVQAHFETLVACGDNIELSPEVQKRFLEQAIGLAQAESLDGQDAREALQQLEARIAEQAPIPLPDGAQATVLGVHTGPDPCVFAVDFVLQDSAGKHLAGLQSKDVKIVAGSREARVLGLCAGSLRQEPLSVALLLDASNSTKGQPLLEAKRGAKSLLAGLPNGTCVKLFAFSSTVVQLCEWTPNMSEVSACIDKIQSDGQTALLSALATAAQELLGRETSRAIVVFTDGYDTVGGPSLNETLARCQANEISVSAIALASAQLDARSLEQSAAATKGSFLPAESLGDVTRRFGELAARLQNTVYRATALAQAANSAPIILTIGGDKCIRLTIEPTQFQPTRLQKGSGHTVAP